MHPLLQTAIAADDAYNAELRRQFGNLANIRRYQSRYHNDATSAAREHYARSMAAWLPVARTALLPR